LLDVATGALLGQLCIFAFPVAGVRQKRPGGLREDSLTRSSKNLRVASLYALGSAAFGILGIALGWWLLLWPASSLALIAIAYVRGSSRVFRKRRGRLPISTRIVLGPYLCGAFARVLVYRRRDEPWVEVAPGVYCGRILLTDREARALMALGVTGVLDLTAEHAERRALMSNDYLNIPVLDLTRPSREQLDRATSFIAEHARRGGVYVHCALGVSRSVAAVAEYLASRYDRPSSATFTYETANPLPCVRNF
jgi:hypothetical protein